MIELTQDELDELEQELLHIVYADAYSDKEKSEHNLPVLFNIIEKLHE